MALSLETVAYGAVVVGGAVLFFIGTPSERAVERPMVVMPAAQAVPRPRAVASVSGDGVTLHSVSIELPSSDRSFPGGAAADVVTSNCTACHSPGMVLNQPPLSANRWRTLVEHMRENYKAPIAQSDVAAIVAYLAKVKEPETP